jgi:hypothetical protein
MTMKMIASAILVSLFSATAFAGGTAYYTTARVTITGPSDWGPVPNNVTTSNTYTVSASTYLTGVGVSGDLEFSIDTTGCPSVQNCMPTVSLLASVGGDYSATIAAGAAGNGPRVRPGFRSYAIRAHVMGANYTLSGLDNGDSSATFTLTSTGEEDLVTPTLDVFTYNNVGAATILSTTCPTDLLPTGHSCDIVVGFRPPDESSGYGYLELQVSGNTRPQAPGRVTVVVPIRDN